MKKTLQKTGLQTYTYLRTALLRRPWLSAGVLVLVAGLGYGTYAYFGTQTTVAYTIAAVSRGTVESSISASGQVAALNTIDLKAKASGDVVWVSGRAGNRVRAGQALVGVDSRDKQQAILDAEQKLREAELQYQQDTAQAPIDFTKAEESITDAKRDLSTQYSDTYSTLSNAYLALPTVLTDTEDSLYNYDLSTSRWNIDVYRSSFTDQRDVVTMTTLTDAASRDYADAHTVFDASVRTFKSLSRSSLPADIDAFLAQAIPATTRVAAAVESSVNLLDAYVDLAQTYNRTIPTVVTQTQTRLRSDLTSANTQLSALLTAQRALDTKARAVRDAERARTVLTIGNPTGSDPISLQSSRYSIEDQKRTIANLRAELADYTVVAPFSGTLATFDVQRYETVSQGTSVGSLITDEKVAQLTLNEVDSARISLGQIVTLTFDAIDGLTATGTVAEISPVGTVSQGVVSYDVKVVFMVPDDRVKPGMTVNATIAVARKENVLRVPQSAVKTSRGQSYVEVVASVTEPGKLSTSEVPEQVLVETGLESDTDIEIVSGVTEGQLIIVRTNTGTAETATQTQGGPPMRL
jgi:RND family efflux transporter MFP subunit